MARKPEVFARSLEPEEARWLVKITRSAKDRVRLRRAGIVLASAQGRSAGAVAMMFAATDRYVREVIHAAARITYPTLLDAALASASSGPP